MKKENGNDEDKVTVCFELPEELRKKTSTTKKREMFIFSTQRRWRRGSV